MRSDNETIAFLQLLGHGEFLGCLHDAILDVERGITNSATGKPGEISVKIKIAPTKGRKRLLTFDVKAKPPFIPTTGTYAFATDQGQFVEDDPDQAKLPLNTVPMEDKKLRTVGAGA